jgi:hypothetical protein
MARPNLSDPAEYMEYRRELRAYLRPWRIAAVAIVILSAIWLGFVDISTRPAWAAFIAGWAFLIVIIVLRTRYHRRRMSETA